MREGATSSVHGDDASALARPAFAEAVAVWLHIGLTSFGGPAGQIAMMHRVLVDEKKWLDERTYLLALNFCTLLPGPEAMQLATYAGWRLHGVRGGLAAGLLFVLPGAALILLLAMLYGWYGNVPMAMALFTGIKAAVLAIVVEALLRIARRSLRDGAEWMIAAFSFAAIFFFRVPFPAIVLAAGLFGYVRWRGRDAPEDAARESGASLVAFSGAETMRTLLTWLSIWLLPLAGVAILAGSEHVLTRLAVFFTKLAVVSFGGAYALLAYMAQDVVQTHGWLAPGEMLDGLGLAETTPGPLILVTEFVGYLAAFRHGGGPQFLMGLSGALITLWATFAPTFLFIFAGAPYIEWLKSAPRLKSALSAITAAVVGVILNLSLWFALHVLFRQVAVRDFGLLHVQVPDLASVDVGVCALAAAAALMLFRLHMDVVATLSVCAALSLAAALL